MVIPHLGGIENPNQEIIQLWGNKFWGVDIHPHVRESLQWEGLKPLTYCDYRQPERIDPRSCDVVVLSQDNDEGRPRSFFERYV